MPLGESALRQAVSAAGGRFVGVQLRPRGNPLLLFNSPAGSTLAVDVVGVLAEAVKAKLQPPAAEASLVPLAVRVVAELHRIGEVLETLVEVEALDERRVGAQRLVARRLGAQRRGD